jgi:hypothetical protein
MQMASSAAAKFIESTRGIVIVGIDEEIPILFAQDNQQKVKVELRDVGDGHEIRCAGLVGVPLIERQHEGKCARNVQSAFLNRLHGGNRPIGGVG